MSLGHATPSQLREIARLEAGAKERGDRRALLDYAQVLLEPAHRDDDAFAIYEVLLARDRRDADAAVGASYVHIHTHMATADLRHAVALLTGVMDDEAAAGRGEMLLAEALGDLGELPADRHVHLLEQSVGRAPTWTRNHMLLAIAYRDAGDVVRARLHIARAIQNRFSELREISLVEGSFEQCYTGRMGSAAFIEEIADTIG